MKKQATDKVKVLIAFDNELMEMIKNAFGTWDTESLRIALHVRRMANYILVKKRKKKLNNGYVRV